MTIKYYLATQCRTSLNLSQWGQSSPKALTGLGTYQELLSFTAEAFTSFRNKKRLCWENGQEERIPEGCLFCVPVALAKMSVQNLSTDKIRERLNPAFDSCILSVLHRKEWLSKC